MYSTDRGCLLHTREVPWLSLILVDLPKGASEVPVAHLVHEVVIGNLKVMMEAEP